MHAPLFSNHFRPQNLMFYTQFQTRNNFSPIQSILHKSHTLFQTNLPNCIPHSRLSQAEAIPYRVAHASLVILRRVPTGIIGSPWDPLRVAMENPSDFV